MNKASFLPAVIRKQQFPQLDYVQILKPKLQVVWERVITIDYGKTTLGALLPVIDLVDNQDLFKVNSIKRGTRRVKLSLVDLWEDKALPYPDMTKVYELLAAYQKEAAGIIELSMLAQIAVQEKDFLNQQDFFVLATREYNSLGRAIKSFPSLSRDTEHGLMLGTIYDWVIKNHHLYFLIVG
jgi:hypothetical protein